MKALTVSTLIIFGGVWLYYTMFLASVARTSAMSDAMQLEADLIRWADDKIAEGKLKERDALEIFPKNNSLRFGGENPRRNFREMIEHTALISTPPLWPGVILVVVGVVGAFRLPSASQKKRKAEQNLPPNV